MRSKWTAQAVAGLWIFSPIISSAAPTEWNFALKPLQSGLAASIGIEFTTSGTLIGAYDADANPEGTRTKPGLFGTFGPTDNDPVAIDLGVGVGGDVATQAAGSFRLLVNPALGTASISGFDADLLAGGPAALTASVNLLTEAFRTRNPSSVYLGGIPISIPVGQASLTSLAIQQAGGGVGVLTPAGADTFQFVVAPLVSLTAAVEVLGMPLVLPPTPVPLVLAGTLVITGDSASIVSIQPVDFDQQLDPNLALPQQPLALPTILPPGGTADVLLDLTLDAIGASLAGELSFAANGELVPEPATAWLLLIAAAAMRRR